MTINSNNQKPVVHQPAAVCDAYETISKYVSLLPCMFITAFVGEEYAEEYCELLANAIIKSDLTYIKCQCGMNEAFCVVNNGYTNEDFIKLGIDWCKKYESETVLISFPIREKVNQRRLVEIVGKVYNGMGQVNEELEFDVPFTNADECFAKVFGMPAALEDNAQIVTTDLTPPATINGHRMAHTRFKIKYPSLF
jgi:hypothetical protein